MCDAHLYGADLRDANLGGIIGVLTHVPVQIINTKYFITIYDNHARIGCLLLSFEKWATFEHKEFSTQEKEVLLALFKVLRPYSTFAQGTNNAI